MGVGRDIYIKGAIAYTTNNIISKLLFNLSYGFDDKDYAERYNRIMRAFALFNPTFLHWRLPFAISRHLPTTKELIQLRTDFMEFNKKCFNKRRPEENSGLSGEPECVADCLHDLFASESEDRFSEDDVPYILTDIFMAGQETTT